MLVAHGPACMFQEECQLLQKCAKLIHSLRSLLPG